MNLSEETTNKHGGGKITGDKLNIVFSAGAQGDLNRYENEKAEMKQLNCTFYGDFKLPSNPTTFEDAVKVYNDLPKMLGENGEHAVPVRVWLYPLVKLGPRAAKCQRNISTDVIRAVESVIESLNVTSMKCGDLMEDTVAKTFNTFYVPVQGFQKFCVEYKQDFMKKLGSILPQIRGIRKPNIKILSELLEAHEKSPFNSRDLQQWITVKEKESNQIKALLKKLQELGAEVVADRDEYLLNVDLNVENLVSYTFTCLQHPEPLLTKQEIYLNPSTIDNPSKNTPDLNFVEKSWTSDELMSMRNNLKLFKDLITLNKSHENTKFIVESVPQTPDKPSSCILMYENGCSEATCFVPPSKPTCPIIECVTDNSITVQLSSSCADTLKRRLLYKMKQENDWKSQTVTEDRVTLINLKEGTDYEIKCAAVGKMDYTVESDVTITTTQSVLKSQTELKATKSESTQKGIEKVNEITYPDSFATGVQDQSQHEKGAEKKQELKTEEKGKITDMFSGNKVFLLVTGNTFKAHEKVMEILKTQKPDLQVVEKVDESDYVLVFCPIVSQAGTDIEAALKKLQEIAGSKPALLVVLHHTFDTDCVVPESTRAVKRNNSIAVDCLFHEDLGLLQSPKNSESLRKITSIMKPQDQSQHEKGAEKKQELKTEEKDSVLRILVLGRKDSGKRLGKNIILGRDWKNQAAASSDKSIATQESKSTEGKVAGRKVTVVETPDLFSAELSREKLRNYVEEAIELSKPGPHAILLILKGIEVNTVEELKVTFLKMEEIFGDRCWKYTTIIFSVTNESLKNSEEFIQSGDQEVQTLVEKCGKRCHFLNIEENEDGSQVPEYLLKKIEKMVGGNRENFYSSEIYLKTLASFGGIEEKIKRIKKEIREKSNEEENMETERNKMSTLNEIWRDILNSAMKIHEEFSKKIEEDEKMYAELSEMYYS
ncbi:hypothetical protein QTP70_002596 [Hemibagrus guttatus]|uniref:Uncharacterized protein n=1 Tax=Hemibagrus guttatus TaxID=175788 RepID=A0AAE0PVX7_9TELE|nr:hypothetical protein QTP70_002596 [Hemibagrus guttatus]